jgi:hypothetical protein
MVHKVDKEKTENIKRQILADQGLSGTCPGKGLEVSERSIANYMEQVFLKKSLKKFPMLYGI